MKVFLSSTFLDLLEEREAVLEVLHKKQVSTLAMEYFVASPNTPLETALDKLRKADVMVLVIGFNAGSLLPDGSGDTYTSAEYDEWLRIGRAPLLFIKTKAQPGQRIPSWCNDEENDAKRAALAEFKARASKRSTPAYFSTPDKLALEVIFAVDQWEALGRPGARKTFASTREYFQGKNPAGQFQILDFDTTLLGREDQMRALNAFTEDDKQRAWIKSSPLGTFARVAAFTTQSWA